MSLIIEWDLIPDADKYHLYRSESKFALKTLPTDMVEIDGKVNSHEYTDVKRQTVYWFVIKTIDKSGGETFSEIFNQGYFPETGPGPQTLLRGDWEFGFFGEVSASEVGIDLPADYTAIDNKLREHGVPPSGASLLSGSCGVWLKCIVGGNIVFIPSLHTTISYSLRRYSVDYVGLGLSGPDFDIASSPVLTFGKYDYQCRMPLASLTRAGFQTVDLKSDDFYKSELSMINSLTAGTGVDKELSTSDQNDKAKTYRRFGDYPYLAMTMSLHVAWAGSSSSAAVQPYRVETNNVIGEVAFSISQYPQRLRHVLVLQF